MTILQDYFEFLGYLNNQLTRASAHYFSTIGYKQHKSLVIKRTAKGGVDTTPYRRTKEAWRSRKREKRGGVKGVGGNQEKARGEIKNDSHSVYFFSSPPVQYGSGPSLRSC